MKPKRNASTNIILGFCAAVASLVILSCDNGQDAAPCTVGETEDGAVIVCPDGSTATISNGESGADGTVAENDTAQDGADGENGIDGQDGTSCTVEDVDEGALITCTDGTQVLVQDGRDGTDGTNGTTGTNGIDGSSCSAAETTGGIQISCTDGSVVTIPTSGETNDGDGVFVNGTRLIMYRYVGEDGSIMPSLQFYDTLLEVKCGIAMHKDGTYRCLPTNYQAQYFDGYFADSACTQHLAIDSYANYSSAPPTYVVQYNLVGDESVRGDLRYNVYSVGTILSGNYFAKSGDGTCMEISASTSTFYRVGAEIASSTFVGFELE